MLRSDDLERTDLWWRGGQQRSGEAWVGSSWWLDVGHEVRKSGDLERTDCAWGGGHQRSGEAYVLGVWSPSLGLSMLVETTKVLSEGGIS